MAVHIRTARLRGPGPSDPTTQDITVAGLRDPRACLAFYSRGLTDDTRRADGQWGIGFTNGTKSRAFCLRDEDGASTADNGRGSANRLVIVPGAFADNVVGLCSFDSWLNTGSSQGIRVDWDDPHQAEVAYVLFGGVEAGVEHFTSSPSIGGFEDVDFGFDPDALVIVGGRSFGGAAGVTAGLRMSLGLVARGPSDSVEGGGAFFFQQDNPPANTVCASSDSELYKGRHVNGNPITFPPLPFFELLEAIEVSWITDGVRFTTREVAASQPYAVLALRSLGSERWSAGRVNARTTTGTQPVTFPGWRAEGALAIATAMTGSVDSGFANDQAARFAVGAACAQGEEFTAGMIADAEASTTDVDSIIDSRFLNLEAVGGGAKVKVQNFTPTASGWDQDFVVGNPGDPFHLFYLAVEAPRIAPDPLEVVLEPQAPQLDRKVVPGPLELVVDPQAPRLDRALQPGPLELVLEPQGPQLDRKLSPAPLEVVVAPRDPRLAVILEPTPVAVGVEPFGPAELSRDVRPAVVEVLLAILPVELVGGAQPSLRGAFARVSLEQAARVRASLGLVATTRVLLEGLARVEAALERAGRAQASLGPAARAEALVLERLLVRVRASLESAARVEAPLPVRARLAAELQVAAARVARLNLAALHRASLGRTIRA